MPRTTSSRKESDLQSDVEGYLRGRGDCWWVVTTPPGVPKGTPDILVCCQGLFVALELKREVNAGYGTTHSQNGNIRLIQKHGGIANTCRSLAEVHNLLPPVDKIRSDTDRIPGLDWDSL